MSMLLLHRTQCFLKILGWGSSWYDAIFYTYLSWWGKLGSYDFQGSVVEEEFILHNFFPVKLFFNLLFLFHNNCTATILMIIILLRCLLAFTISFDGVGCNFYDILMISNITSLVFLWKSHIEKKIKHSVAQHEFICITSKAFQKLP